jgi:hypothetical protein
MNWQSARWHCDLAAPVALFKPVLPEAARWPAISTFSGPQRFLAYRGNAVPRGILLDDREDSVITFMLCILLAPLVISLACFALMAPVAVFVAVGRAIWGDK